MKRSVRVLNRARRDLQEIYDFVVRETPMRADALIDKLLDKIQSLDEMADRGTTPRDAIVAARGYRVRIHGDFLIFYKTSPTLARVHRVMRGTRAYRELL